MSRKVKLTVKQQRFVEEYCANGFNALQAAIKAGYKENSARTTGWENLNKPYIADAIRERLNKLSLSSEETTKMIADMAKANITDYMTTRKEVFVPKVKKHLSDVIEELEMELEIKEEFAKVKGLRGKELKSYNERLVRIKDRILMLELQLKRDPEAHMIVDGPEELIDVQTLDLEKLEKDKELGRVKTFKQTRNGIEVELYPADAALDKLAKIHGLYRENMSLEIEEKGTMSVENWQKLMKEERDRSNNKG